MPDQINSTSTSSVNISDQSEAPTIPPATPPTPAPVINYIWNYVSSTVGGQSTLPPIWWTVTALLLAAILFFYRRRPQLLSIGKGGLSTPILLMLCNHLLNNIVFLVSTYLINTVVAYNGAVINVSNWLNTWWSFCEFFYYFNLVFVCYYRWFTVGLWKIPDPKNGPLLNCKVESGGYFPVWTPPPCVTKSVTVAGSSC